jgi:hypothetical protein
MHLGWKVVLPTALAFITLMGASILVLDSIALEFGLVYGLILTAVNAVACLLFFFVLDRDRVIRGASAAPERRLPAGVTAVRMARPINAEEASWPSA